MITKEKKAAYDKIYAAANREKRSAHTKAWHAANRNRLLAKQKIYAAAHPNECLAFSHKRRAKKFGVKIGDTVAILVWIKGWRTEAPASCHYCKKVTPGTEMTIDHVIPISKGGDHDLTNLVVCCKSCNNSKQDKLPEVWMAQINL
jgi:5-methylcytosine-specific restriction endonuclease McrA